MTFRVSYISLHNVFGFGLPYTLLTRAPFEPNMFFVGVPPWDVLARLLLRDAAGLTPIDKKKRAVHELLSNETALQQHLEDRIGTGEFDLDRLGMELAARTDQDGLSPGGVGPHNTMSAEILARKYLLKEIREQLQTFSQRLDVRTGLRNMCATTEGFRLDGNTVRLWANRVQMWKSLAEVSQQDDATRQKILYYKTIALEWMTHPSVDLLARATPDAALHPLRRSAGASESSKDGAIQGYLHAGLLEPREPFPAAPSNFRWGDGKRERRIPMSRPGEEAPPHTLPSGTASTSAAAEVPLKIPRRVLLQPCLRLNKTASWHLQGGRGSTLPSTLHFWQAGRK